MNKTLYPARVRSLQELSFQHQKLSLAFLSKSLSPSAQLTTPLTRYATDGSFNRREGFGKLVR